jgi:hypothetical protein
LQADVVPDDFEGSTDRLMEKFNKASSIPIQQSHEIHPKKEGTI